MPGLLLIAGKAASQADIVAMREGLKAAMSDPVLAQARERLGIAGVRFLTRGEYSRMNNALQAIAAAGVRSLL